MSNKRIEPTVRAPYHAIGEVRASALVTMADHSYLEAPEGSFSRSAKGSLYW